MSLNTYVYNERKFYTINSFEIKGKKILYCFEENLKNWRRFSTVLSFFAFAYLENSTTYSKDLYMRFFTSEARYLQGKDVICMFKMYLHYIKTAIYNIFNQIYNIHL